MSDYLTSTRVFEVIHSLYLSRRDADVFFVFPNDRNERVPAHKLFLSTSEKFAKLFADGENEFKIYDVPINAFKEFLQFFYMPNCNVTSIVACLKVARKYGSKEILSTLIIMGYENAHQRGDNISLLIFAENVANYTEAVVQSNEFLGIDRETLKQILEMDTLRCNEVKILKSCVDWAKEIALNEGLDSGNLRILRHTLADLVYRIRFKSMTIEEFLSFTSSFGGDFFSLEEFKDITLLIGLKDHQSFVFSNKQRIEFIETSEYEYFASIVEQNRLITEFDNDVDWNIETRPEIKKGMLEAGLNKATRVQNEILPLVMANVSVAVTTKTCEGKTISLIIAMLNSIEETTFKTQAICFVYTIPAAIAMKKELEKLAKYTEITVDIVHPDAMPKPNTHILIGTSIELSKYIDNHNLISTNALKLACFDDYDVTSGFNNAIQVSNALRNMGTTVVYCSSFKLPSINTNQQLQHIDESHNATTLNASIKHYFWTIGENSSIEELMKILSAVVSLNTSQILVFTETKKCAKTLVNALRHKFNVALLINDCSFQHQVNTIDNFDSKKVQILVTTNIISRGLLSENICLVINYGVPHLYGIINTKSYVFRASRTGRRRNGGTVVTLCNSNEAKALESHLKTKFQIMMHDFRQVSDDRLFALEPAASSAPVNRTHPIDEVVSGGQNVQSLSRPSTVRDINMPKLVPASNNYGAQQVSTNVRDRDQDRRFALEPPASSAPVILTHPIDEVVSGGRNVRSLSRPSTGRDINMPEHVLTTNNSLNQNRRVRSRAHDLGIFALEQPASAKVGRTQLENVEQVAVEQNAESMSQPPQTGDGSESLASATKTL